MKRFLSSVFPYLLLILLISKNVAAEVKYSVGIVPQFDARKTTEIWQPILEQIRHITGITLVLKTSPSIPVFEEQFNAGKFDFAYMNPYHALIANKSQGYIPLLRDNGRQLYGIVVVKNDSPIKSISELDGKTVAFPAPNALGAALIPRTEFAEKFNIKVKESFVKSHSSVYLSVLLGHSAAGGGVQKTLSQQPEDVRNALRILYKTSKVAPHPVTAHQRIKPSVREKIKAAFISLGNYSEGKELLIKIPMKQIGSADMNDYAPLRKMGLEKYYVKK